MHSKYFRLWSHIFSITYPLFLKQLFKNMKIIVSSHFIQKKSQPASWIWPRGGSCQPLQYTFVLCLQLPFCQQRTLEKIKCSGQSEGTWPFPLYFPFLLSEVHAFLFFSPSNSNCFQFLNFFTPYKRTTSCFIRTNWPGFVPQRSGSQVFRVPSLRFQVLITLLLPFITLSPMNQNSHNYLGVTYCLSSL